MRALSFAWLLSVALAGAAVAQAPDSTQAPSPSEPPPVTAPPAAAQQPASATRAPIATPLLAAGPQLPAAFRLDVSWSPDGMLRGWSEFWAVEPDTTPGWNIWVATPVGTGRMRVITDAQWVDWSPDGKKLVYCSGWDGNWDVYVAKSDGSDPKRITRDAAKDRQPAWSPRSDKIAFISDREGTPQLFVMNSDGGDVKRLTNDSTAANNPAWSADGTHITWYAREGAGDRLHVANADGSGASLVTTPDAGGIYPCFLPDGRLLYAGMTPAGRKLLSVVETNGAGHGVLSGLEAFFARPSRDGRRIAFVSGAWPRSRIGVARSDGSAARVIVGDPRETATSLKP